MFNYEETVAEIIGEAIAKDRIAGANILAFQNGRELIRKSFGYADKENRVPMKYDTIFRMFSMTKPVTSAAVMMLAERGKLDVRDSLAKYIPEFAHAKVRNADGTLSEANRDITIWDLLHMTSGIPYPNPDTPSGREMEREFDRIKARLEAGRPTDTLECCRRAAQIPLCFHPGTKWMYGLSADILGGVVEVASGRRYGQFLRDEIFEPLGMQDTGFYVPKDKWDRFAVNYIWKEEQQALVPFLENHLGMEGYTEDICFESGGAGLVSTIGDYGRFARMLVNGGTLDGVRILGRKTVEFMAQDHLQPEQKVDYIWDSVTGHGYGCLMRVLTDRGQAGTNASLGEFGWDGWTGNYVTMDPSEKLVLLYFIQLCDAGTTMEVRKLRMATYGAL